MENVQEPPKNQAWVWAEVGFGLLAFAYFLFYDRDTLVDFVVLSCVCVLLWLVRSKIGLPKLDLRPFSVLDLGLLILSIGVFSAAWGYGIVKGKVTWETAGSSLLITTVYFYYAFIQHYLAQTYLALRMYSISQKIKNKSYVVPLAALLTGGIFGLLHITYPHLMLASSIGGAVFAYYYLSTGRFWAVVCAHSLVSSPSLYWFLDDNPFTELMFWV